MKQILRLLLAALITVHIPQASQGQVPDDFLEEDDFDQAAPNGNFPPPPPVEAPQPPTADAGSDGGGSSGFTPPVSSGGTNPRFNSVKKRSRSIPFSKAQPEDITNENFPELIESFDYPNAEIADLVKAISELTGKNFIVEPSVRGKITIIAPTPITVAEAYKAFLSALAINGFTVVPSGKFMKIRPTRAAVRDNMEIYSGAYTPNTDQMVTRIINMKYISAEEVGKQLKNLTTQSGEFQVYGPTNSLIISDFGSNIERVIKIVSQLDVPGFEEQLEVIPIKRAKSKDIADLIDQIINKGQGRKQGQGFTAGIPRFNRPGDGAGGNNPFSLVLPDERTNAIIVVGNKEGIRKIRELVQKLDYEIRPEDAGGIYVYYVKYGEAEKIAEAIQGVAKDTGKKGSSGGGSGGGGAGGDIPNFGGAAVGGSSSGSAGLLGGEVKITHSKETNSLIITASRQDYDVILALLAKLDIPRDQVFVEALIMEMNAENNTAWGVNYYQFAPGTKGVGRIGFSSGNLQDLLNVTKDSGAILGFGSGETFDLAIPGGGTVPITSFASFVQFLKGQTNVNILSTPQILAMDNEEAFIEVGDNVPINPTSSSNGTTTTGGVQREKATIKLIITPYINPTSDQVRLKLDQQIKQVSNKPVRAEALAQNSLVLTERQVKSNITIPNGDTAVIGGLIREEEQVAERKVPILGDIPILGWLFKGRSTQKAKINLLVFITPKIIRNKSDQRNLLGNKLNERLDFVKDNLGGRDPYGKAVDKVYRKTSKDKTVAPTPVE